jgi:Zn-finger protein
VLIYEQSKTGTRILDCLKCNLPFAKYTKTIYFNRELRNFDSLRTRKLFKVYFYLTINIDLLEQTLRTTNFSQVRHHVFSLLSAGCV